MASGTKSLRQAAKTLPPLRKLIRERDRLMGEVADLEAKVRDLEAPHDALVQLWPPGHYYSALPSAADVARFDADHQRLASQATLPGIDLNPRGQLELIHLLAAHHSPVALPESKQVDRRYYADNDFFSYGDAVVLQAMLRFARPRRLVEVGSGFSSALILDTREAYLDSSMDCTFIEPYPERLDLLLSDTDRESADIIVAPVQDAPLSVFENLGTNDILFIDSSHVSKLASDVNMLVFSVLPLLKPGVYVHIHDVFYPFDYPGEWVHQGRSWSEAYLVRAFLEFNDAFEVVLFNSYLQHFHRAEVAAVLPLWDRNPGGSLWLRRRPST